MGPSVISEQLEEGEGWMEPEGAGSAEDMGQRGAVR